MAIIAILCQYGNFRKCASPWSATANFWRISGFANFFVDDHPSLAQINLCCVPGHGKSIDIYDYLFWLVVKSKFSNSIHMISHQKSEFWKCRNPATRGPISVGKFYKAVENLWAAGSSSCDRQWMIVRRFDESLWLLGPSNRFWYRLWLTRHPGCLGVMVRGACMVPKTNLTSINICEVRICKANFDFRYPTWLPSKCLLDTRSYIKEKYVSTRTFLNFLNFCCPNFVFQFLTSTAQGNCSPRGASGGQSHVCTTCATPWTSILLGSILIEGSCELSQLF